ncbi:FkbM family methyltransferase [Algoriphagus aquimarinus]|uniref:FkbM family methyltransferase n=1 Tax=Algoriphagus aquimarinus TaxID=237018 RepID=UPI0030DD8F94
MKIYKINIFFHSIIFALINSEKSFYNFLYKNSYFSKWLVIDPKKTFRKNFPENQKFSFIQIGGNDGVSFDFLYSEVIKRDSYGLIVEPSPKYFKELENNYIDFKNIFLLKKAIFKSNSIVKLYEVNSNGLKKIPDWGKGVGSIDKKNLTKNELSDDDIDVIEVEGITFMDMLDNYPEFTSVNYLQIDTEGFDFEILKLIDFSKFQCDFIRYEKANLSLADLLESEVLLKKQGYQIVSDEYDNFCFKPPLTYQLKYHRN